MKSLPRRLWSALPPVKRLKDALAVRESTIENLKRNLGEALKDRDAYAGHVMRLERERGTAVELYQQSEAALAEMRGHAERLGGEREELIGSVTGLQAELEATQKQVEGLRGQRDELESERNDLQRYLTRDEAEIERLRDLVGRAGALVPVAFPNGHFYSPVVDPREERLARLLSGGPRIEPFWRDQANGPMRALYERLSRHGDALSFLGTGLYRAENPAFWRGDAWVLAAMVAEFRPRRVVEAGCGHSSCVLIDLNEHLRPGEPMELTFIDPHPETLYGLLREDDPRRSRVLERRLEEVDSTLFDTFDSDDILFLDTSHVVKTGGEVAYAINEVLPRLKPGVLVHIHDIFAGWEYPADWVLDDHRSWSEIYMVRLLAEQSRDWEVVFFNDLCAKVWNEPRVAGSSLWLRKLSPA